MRFLGAAQEKAATRPVPLEVELPGGTRLRITAPEQVGLCASRFSKKGSVVQRRFYPLKQFGWSDHQRLNLGRQLYL